PVDSAACQPRGAPGVCLPYAATRERPGRRPGPAGRRCGGPGRNDAGDPGAVPGRRRPARVPFRRVRPAPARGCAGCGAGRDGEDARLPRPPGRRVAAAVLADPAHPGDRHAAAAQFPPALDGTTAGERGARVRLGRRCAGPAATPRRARGACAAGRGAGGIAGTPARGVHAARAGRTGRGRYRARDGLQRRLGEDPPVAGARSAAAATGGLAMNDLEFDRRARAVHDQSLQALSPRVRAQLHNLLQAAVAPPRTRHAHRWGVATAAALAVVVGFGVNWYGIDEPAATAGPDLAALGTPGDEPL